MADEEEIRNPDAENANQTSHVGQSDPPQTDEGVSTPQEVEINLNPDFFVEFQSLKRSTPDCQIIVMEKPAE